MNVYLMYVSLQVLRGVQILECPSRQSGGMYQVQMYIKKTL